MSDTPETPVEPDAPVETPATEPEAPPAPSPYVEEPGNPQTNEPIVPVSPPEIDPSTPRQPDAAAAAVLFDPHLERYVPDLGGAVQGADGL